VATCRHKFYEFAADGSAQTGGVSSSYTLLTPGVNKVLEEDTGPELSAAYKWRIKLRLTATFWRQIGFRP
jgi:hypothetical protein